MRRTCNVVLAISCAFCIMTIYSCGVSFALRSAPGSRNPQLRYSSGPKGPIAFPDVPVPRYTITPEGEFIDEQDYPVLRRMLTPAEYRHMLELFSRFDTYQESYPLPLNARCYDEPTLSFERSEGDSIKHVWMDACAGTDGPHGQDVSELLRIASAFDSLGRTMSGFVPWYGATVSFAVDKMVYGPGEPIRLTITLSNPTNEIRRFMFRRGCRYYFGLSSPENHIRYDQIGQDEPRWTDHESEISLDPGEVKTLLHVIDPAKLPEYAKMPPGEYRLSVDLNLGREHDAYSTAGLGESPQFRIADPLKPVEGFGRVRWRRDEHGIDSIDCAVTIQNWMDRSMKLEFAGNREVDVDVFVSFKTDTVFFFRDGGNNTVQSSQSSHTVVLQPGEIQSFHRFLALDLEKIGRSLNHGSNHYECRMRLRCLNASLEKIADFFVN